MAFLKVEIPDGKFCDHCVFNTEGTVICNCFDVFLSEETTQGDEFEIDHCVKCKQCMESLTTE